MKRICFIYGLKSHMSNTDGACVVVPTCNTAISSLGFNFFPDFSGKAQCPHSLDSYWSEMLFDLVVSGSRAVTGSVPLCSG